MQIERATMKRKMVRDAVYCKLYAIDGTRRDADEQNELISANLSLLAETAGFPEGTQMMGAMIEQFLTFGTYVSIVPESNYEQLAATDTLGDIATKFAMWLELDEATIKSGIEQIEQQQRPVNPVTAPGAGELTEAQKKAG